MSDKSEKNNLVSDESINRIRNHFLGWQCRLRQYSVRNLNGEPSKGMRPDLVIGDTGSGYEGVTILLVRNKPDIITAEFKHMIQRTKDPKQRYDSALKFLAENYYQYPKKFSDCPTAIFPVDSRAAEQILAAGKITLVFEEKSQRYKIPCSVKKLDDSDPAWQAAYWHNHLFNPVMPGNVPIVQFVPDWALAEANPSVY